MCAALELVTRYYSQTITNTCYQFSLQQGPEGRSTRMAPIRTLSQHQQQQDQSWEVMDLKQQTDQAGAGGVFVFPTPEGGHVLDYADYGNLVGTLQSFLYSFLGQGQVLWPQELLNNFYSFWSRSGALATKVA